MGQVQKKNAKPFVTVIPSTSVIVVMAMALQTVNHPPAGGQLLSALASSSSLPQLKCLHAQIIKLDHHRSSSSLLVKLLLSTLSLSPPTPSTLDYALSVFAHLPDPITNPRISNKLLREMSRSRRPDKTLFVYQKIRMDGCCSLDRFSFPPLLKAVSKIEGLEEGREVHGVVTKLGFQPDPFVQTGLVAMYSACGRIEDARAMFDKMSHRDVVAWSIMLDGYCQSGHFDQVLMLFEEMCKSNDVVPDGMILSSVLFACGHAANLEYGKSVQKFIDESNLNVDPHLQSALITMYSSCGSMDLAQSLFNKLSVKSLVVSTAMLSGYSKQGQVEAARAIFDQMHEKDLVCWSAMISGYAESDWPQEALNLFSEMEALSIRPDQVTMLSVISACAHLGALDRAKWIHKYIDENRFGGVLPVNNALIDMYAKCGSLESARRVFDKMQKKNVISWTSMINAFAMHGDVGNALKFFRLMEVENVKPNSVTFVGVLYACSHAGLVDEGKKIFDSMSSEYKINPKQEHYGCMVDLLGRANQLREALELVEAMPLAPNIIVWGSLMAACRVHGEIELGEFAAKRLLDLDPNHDGAHVLLSNIYAKERRWDDVGLIRKLMKSRGIIKEKGYSRVELRSGIHEFLTADRNHKQADQIYEKLDEVVRELKMHNYAPDSCSVLLDLKDEEKKEVVLWHSEKLALCYGLLSDGKGSCIRIVKNLRICDDCHTFMKLVSEVYQTQIIVRDRTRFHHYKGGACSCKDYW